MTAVTVPERDWEYQEKLNTPGSPAWALAHRETICAQCLVHSHNHCTGWKRKSDGWHGKKQRCECAKHRHFRREAVA